MPARPTPTNPARAALVALSLLTIFTGPVLAQSWPEKPIKVIVPIGPGSAADIVPRLVMEEAAKHLGQPVVIENRAGAGGLIGAGAVAKAAPDGYTLLAMSSSLTILPSVHKSLPFNVKTDLVPIIALGSIPNALVVAPSTGFRTLADLVVAAKARPGKLNYASVGHGTALHLSAERLRLSAGIEVQHVPYKSGPEVVNELVAGRIDFAYLPVSLVLPQISANNLQVLALSSPARSSSMPNVPTTLELGFAKSDYNFWLGVFVPANTPPAVVARMQDVITKALMAPDVLERLKKLGVEPMPLSASQLQALVLSELDTNAELVRAANIKIE